MYLTVTSLVYFFTIESDVCKADPFSVGGWGAFSSHQGNFSFLIPGAVIRYEMCVNFLVIGDYTLFESASVDHCQISWCVF